jgi:ABC-2 type transport system permease protein
MLKTVFLKTLFEKRYTILIWTLAILVLNIAIIQLFPALRDVFSSTMENMPPELAGWFGDGEIWSSIRGYVGMEIMGQMGIIVIIFGIVFPISIFASEEDSGVLATQLSRPLSRFRYLIEKYAALLAAIFILMIGFTLGTFLGTIIVGDTIPLGELIIPMVAVALIVAVFASLTFAVSAATRLGKTISGVIVGLYAFASYFLTSLGATSDTVQALSKLTPHYYYNTPPVIYNGLELKNVLILVSIALVPLIISAIIFLRRDLKTR